ncbi:8929_t:CDS:2 [Ambispora gerdemannii]|uniref:8929_t:CDS:1 n=1 Tax=Ambispora gerdemannii TaxID=144530 RepID=A0A9N8V7X2_9GLOM|nr:8929_t:CDS:2 [Ambispora gerdemannii]
MKEGCFSPQKEVTIAIGTRARPDLKGPNRRQPTFLALFEAERLMTVYLE